LKKISVAFLIFASLAAAGVSRLAAAPRLTPDERLVAVSSIPTEMDPDSFIAAALIASASDDGLMAERADRARELARRLQAELGVVDDERRAAEYVLTFLYRNVLSRYSLNQTRVDLAIDTGEYNCVSSAILYAYFAKSVGLRVRGVETPQHSFCVVTIGGAEIDVETTNPFGFNPGSSKELPSTGEGMKAYAVVPKTYYANRKTVDDRRLVALIYLNRISALERGGGFEQSVGLAVDAAALQGLGLDGPDIQARVLNYAGSISRAGRHGEALDFIARVTDRLGDGPQYRAFYATAVSAIVAKALQEGRNADALAAIDEHRQRLDAQTAKGLARAVRTRELFAAINEESLDRALADIDRYRAEIAPEDFTKLVVFAFSREAKRVGGDGRWLDAAAVIDRGLKRLPDDRDLLSLRAAYRHNHGVEVHNQFARLYNQGKMAEARRVVEEGLRAVPESAMLQADLRSLR